VRSLRREPGSPPAPAADPLSEYEIEQIIGFFRLLDRWDKEARDATTM